MGASASPAAACEHRRTRLVAQDEDAEFVECLDCGVLLETKDVQPPPNFNESLSDA
jgi:hypothetical protein